MDDGVTLGGWNARRAASLLLGAGMLGSAALTVQHFFGANYPATRAGSPLCELPGLPGCAGVADSAAAQLGGIPIGTFGVLLGMLVVLGALLPSVALERTNRALGALNALAVLALFAYSTLALKSLCLPCTIYGALSLASAGVFLYWRDTEPGSPFVPAPLHLATIGALLAAGGWSMAQYHDAVRGADEGVVATEAVSHFYRLPTVPWPSAISEYWSVRSTAGFEDAAIRIVNYSDPLCSDCRVLYAQLKALAAEFPGKLNVAYQFFPLEAKCNDVVAKDLHPGACDLAYIAAHDVRSFRAVHDEIYDHMQAAKADPAWRTALARRYGAEGALADTALQARVHRLIETGAEYERTSEKYEHGIRSTPTLIINNRMIIGTLPLGHLRAIFRALIEEQEQSGAGFLENWIDAGCAVDPEGGPPKPCT